MDKNKQQAQELLERYKQGLCTPEEIRLLQTTLLEFTDAGQVPDPAILQESSKRVLQQLKPIKKGLPKWYYAAAALIIVALATTLYFYHNDKIVTRQSKLVNEIGPGGNRATLTLANGKTISLDSAKSGIIVQDEDIKYNDGKNVLTEKGRGQGALEELIVTRKSEIVNNILSTPKGGQYQITLEDGTKVWLNAASTLKYPSRFSGKKREVEISGEAFFDVAQIKDQPFKVKSKGQEIDVVGTSFNISSYENEEAVKTTLVSGAIQVSSYAKANGQKPTANSQLTPGDQSTVQSNGDLTKAKVALDGELAWLQGRFSFEGKSFAQIMTEVARWYNLEVIYQGPIPQDTGFGSAKRSDNLSVVLHLLGGSGVKFSIQGRKLIIQNEHH